MMLDPISLKEQLRDMDEQLAALIAVADDQQDFLLGALLAEAHDRVIARYAEVAGA